VKHRHDNDIVVVEEGVKKTIRVPILSIEEMGKDMAIDEKQIGAEMHTVLSNRQTGKIALLARSIRVKELVKLLPKFDLKGFDVKSITRDLSPSYDWFCRQAFCNSLHVADKFHIIKHLLDACQDVRVRKSREEMKKHLNQWYFDVEKDAVMEMENFKSLVERHEGLILNYFVKGDTNALAESINSKIQRFIMTNQGTRDREFFYFRLAMHFSSAPQNKI
jgi:transposase